MKKISLLIALVGLTQSHLYSAETTSGQTTIEITTERAQQVQKARKISCAERITYAGLALGHAAFAKLMFEKSMDIYGNNKAPWTAFFVLLGSWTLLNLSLKAAKKSIRSDEEKQTTVTLQTPHCHGK